MIDVIIAGHRLVSCHRSNLISGQVERLAIHFLFRFAGIIKDGGYVIWRFKMAAIVAHVMKRWRGWWLRWLVGKEIKANQTN